MEAFRGINTLNKVAALVLALAVCLTQSFGRGCMYAVLFFFGAFVVQVVMASVNSAHDDSAIERLQLMTGEAPHCRCHAPAHRPKRRLGGLDFLLTRHSLMFEHLEMRDRALIYQGLVCLVKSNAGVGFCNGDQGHPAYAVGRDGKVDFEAFGDSPDHNRLFKMMHELTMSLGEGDLDGSAEVSERIYCWADFCRLAYEAYEKHRRPST